MFCKLYYRIKHLSILLAQMIELLLILKHLLLILRLESLDLLKIQLNYIPDFIELQEYLRLLFFNNAYHLNNIYKFAR